MYCIYLYLVYGGTHHIFVHTLVSNCTLHIGGIYSDMDALSARICHHESPTCTLEIDLFAVMREVANWCLNTHSHTLANTHAI